MVFRILPHKYRAKANSEGPSGKRALPGERNHVGDSYLFNAFRAFSIRGLTSAASCAAVFQTTPRSTVK